MGGFDIVTSLERLPGLLLGLTVHEYMHARMAYALGDDYAKQDGRLTLNPLKHIDILGFILLMTAGFGWAKPVGFSPYHFKKPKRDEILVALAGPFANIVLAFLFFVIIKGMVVVIQQTGMEVTEGVHILVQTLLMGAYLNLGLFVFNLIPFPPLDGSHLYMPFLAEKNERLFMLIQQYGFGILFILLMADNQMNLNIFPIGPVVEFLGNGIMHLLGI